MNLEENINRIKQVMSLNEDRYNPLDNDELVTYDNRIEPSESVELDEGVWKTDDQWLDLLKKTYPKWDFSNAVLDRKKTHNDNILQIKNVFCTIHNHSFPEEGRTEWISVKKMLDPKRQTGCHDCRVDRYRDKVAYDDVKWINSLSNIEKFKDKVDFSKSKFSYVEPLKNGPLLTKAYCKIHNKNFVPGDPNKDGQGIRCNEVSQRENICPNCIKNSLFVNKAKSIEDWRLDFKRNKHNKNYDYSRSKVNYDDKDIPYVSNIYCNVKGLNGKIHGFYAKGDGVEARLHQKGYYPCPKCECDSKQKKFIDDSIEKHYKVENGVKIPKYLYDRVDFCDDTTTTRHYDFDGNITETRKRVLIGCQVKDSNGKEHGYFLQNPWEHSVRGTGCPICRASKGETHILNLLNSTFGKKYTIERESNAGFKMLGTKLFDFYIPELKVVIEYDGVGHFLPTFGSSDFSRNDSYNRIFESDNLKNATIKSRKNNPNGIRLIRVPYTLSFKEIDVPLLDAIKNAISNQVTYLHGYPRRSGRKEAVSKFKINKPKLSLVNTLKEFNI